MHILAHLFLPHPANFFRAKILHSSSLFILAAFVLMIYFARVPTHVAKILGLTAAFIPAERIIELTNQKRIAAGLAPLSLDPKLVQAAQEKGRDMLARGYWAHVAPSGTTPWSFFLKEGYDYRYAGENLARDFGSPEAVVNAWMASPTHRENLFSGKYENIGIAVVQGDLGGAPTTLVVQFLGKRQGAFPELTRQTGPPPTGITQPVALPQTWLSASTGEGISPLIVKRSLGVGVIVLLLIVLVIDGMVIWRQNIVRISGRTLAHFGFLASLGLLLFIFEGGRIL